MGLLVSIRWFQCPLCVNVKYVKNALFIDDLVLDDFIITAISNVCVLRRVPRDLRVSLAESFLDNLIDVF